MMTSHMVGGLIHSSLSRKYLPDHVLQGYYKYMIRSLQ